MDYHKGNGWKFHSLYAHCEQDSEILSFCVIAGEARQAHKEIESSPHFTILPCCDDVYV